MSSDLVTRLRSINPSALFSAIAREAADEIERLRDCISAREVRSLVDERDRLRPDANRYRWLRGGPEVPPHSTRWPRWEVRYWDGRYWQTLFAEQLDSAIDAAMKEDGK